MIECRLSAPSILIIYPLPHVTVSEQPFVVSRKRDGLKCAGRFLSHADSRARNLTDHEALHHLPRVAHRYAYFAFPCGFSLRVRAEKHRDAAQIWEDPRRNSSRSRIPPRYPSFAKVNQRVAVAVGIPVTRYPPHRSVRALISAYGSYLGCMAANRSDGQGCTTCGAGNQ